MKRGFFCVAFVAVLAAGGLAGAQAPDLEQMDLVLKAMPAGPVARVNGEDVSQDEFAGLYRQEIAMLKARAKTDNVPDSVRLDTGLACLRMLVQRELLYQEALKRKLEVSQEDLEKRWNAEIEAMKRAFPSKGGAEPTEQEILDAAGATQDEARAELKKAFLIDKARALVAAEQKVDVSDAEIREFFKEHGSEFKRADKIHLHQIYAGFKPTGKPEDEKKKAEARLKIEKAIERVQAGESFAAVAKAVSESPDKDNGGDLGPMPAEALPPFYVEASRNLKPGEISGVIESPYGFHAIRLIESESGGEVTFEQAEPHIRKMIEGDKTERALAKWCDQFMQKPGHVEIFLRLDHILETHPELREVAKQAVGDSDKN